MLTLLIVTAMTALNLCGIRATVRANAILLVVSSAMVILFLILAARYLLVSMGWAGLVSLHPVYNPATFKSGTILGGISLAAMTYIGFDGLTTLAEDSVNPKRDIILSTVLIVLITGILSAIELYFLHQVMPDWRSADPDTSYLDVMKLVGGSALFVAFSIVMSISQFGAGFSVQVSAARLLYGMGRDNVLPRALFGYLSPRRGNPSRNIVLVGVLAFLGTVFVPFRQCLRPAEFRGVRRLHGRQSGRADQLLHPSTAGSPPQFPLGRHSSRLRLPALLSVLAWPAKSREARWRRLAVFGPCVLLIQRIVRRLKGNDWTPDFGFDLSAQGAVSVRCPEQPIGFLAFPVAELWAGIPNWSRLSSWPTGHRSRWPTRWLCVSIAEASRPPNPARRLPCASAASSR